MEVATHQNYSFYRRMNDHYLFVYSYERSNVSWDTFGEGYVFQLHRIKSKARIPRINKYMDRKVIYRIVSNCGPGDQDQFLKGSRKFKFILWKNRINTMTKK